MKDSYITRSVDQTLHVAFSFADGLKRGDVIALYGELGSGKTQFVKGVCQYFGAHQQVTSPTFVMLNRYTGRDGTGNELLVYHFDLYRMKSPDEMYDLGYEEFFYSDGICLIEWADIARDVLPARHYDVTLSLGDGEDDRMIQVVLVDLIQTVEMEERFLNL